MPPPRRPRLSEEELQALQLAGEQYGMNIRPEDIRPRVSLFRRTAQLGHDIADSLRGASSNFSNLPKSGTPDVDVETIKLQQIVNLQKQILAQKKEIDALYEKEVESLTKNVEKMKEYNRLGKDQQKLYLNNLRANVEAQVLGTPVPGTKAHMGHALGYRPAYSKEAADARNAAGGNIGLGASPLDMLKGQDEEAFGLRAFLGELRAGNFDMNDLSKVGAHYLGFGPGPKPPRGVTYAARAIAAPAAIGAGIQGLSYATRQARQGLSQPFSQLENIFEALSGVSTIQAGQAAGFSGSPTSGFSGLFNNLRNTLSLGIGTLGIGGAEGAFGFGGNKAMQEGFRRRLDAIRTGMNPFDALSIGEAQEIQDQVSGRGYTGRRAERVEDALERIVKNTSIEAGDALKIFDTVVKDLGADIDDTTKVIINMGEAARAAGKSLPLFFEEVAAGVDALRDAGAGTGSATSGSASDVVSTAMQMAGVEGVPQQVIQGFLTGSMSGQIASRIIRENPDLSFAERALVAQNPLAFRGGEPALQAGIAELETIFNQLMANYGNADLAYTELANIFPELGNAGNVRQLLEANRSGQFSKPSVETTASELSATLQAAQPRKLWGGITMPGAMERNLTGAQRGLLERQINAFANSVQRKAGKDAEGNWVVDQSIKDEIKDRVFSGKTTVEEIQAEANRIAEAQKSEKAVQVGLTEEARRLFKIVDQRPSKTNSNILRQNLPRNAGMTSDTTWSLWRE